MELPEVFTFALLATPAGMVAAVLVVTELVKQVIPEVAVQTVRIIALVVGIAVALTVAWLTGADATAWVVAPLNGALAALAAMKVQETVKHGLTGTTHSTIKRKTRK